MTVALIVLLSVSLALQLLHLASKDAWEVQVSELHTQWLAHLLAEGWEPFAFFPNGTMTTSSRESDVTHERLAAYVAVKRRCRKPKPMTPDDEARWRGSPG